MADEDEIEVSERDRAEAHAALDRWLDDCEREGRSTHERGRSGYMGHMRLLAFVDDTGVLLRIERAFSEDL